MHQNTWENNRVSRKLSDWVLLISPAPLKKCFVTQCDYKELIKVGSVQCSVTFYYTLYVTLTLRTIIYKCRNISFLRIFEESAAWSYYLAPQPPQHHLVSLMLGLRRRIFRSPVTAELHLTSPPLRTPHQFIPCANAKCITPTSAPPYPSSSSSCSSSFSSCSSLPPDC